MTSYKIKDERSRALSTSIYLKVAPNVENTEVFKKGWNFAHRTYFASCIMKKHSFSITVDKTKRTTFFPYFYHEIIFYSADLFDCAVNFKLYLNIFIFLNISIYLQTQIKHQKSNIWIKKQPLNSGSGVQRVKCQGCNFHSCFIL